MDSTTLGKALVDALSKQGFRHYGTKLFYREFADCILILKQETYNMAAELYLRLIIKECHPEITKITKQVLADKMLIDTFSNDKLFFRSDNTLSGWDYNFYNIQEHELDARIDEIAKDYLDSFSCGVINGISHFKAFPLNYSQYSMLLFRDSAEKIGRMEWAGAKGHDWYLSDRYILEFEYKIDSRFLHPNTERYIMENIIPYIPKELTGKAVTKWCEMQCKEHFLAKGKRFFLGWDLPFPFMDGKPLKYCGPQTDDKGKTTLFYLNEDTNELYAYKQIKVNSEDPAKDVYEITKVK